jgi:hypothetical protein
VDSIKNFKEHLKRIDDNYKIFSEKSTRFYVEIQLSKIYHKESLPALIVILNQILEISLKNEPVKKIFIEVMSLFIIFFLLSNLKKY